MGGDAEVSAIEDACAKADGKASKLLGEMGDRISAAKAQTLALFESNQQTKMRIAVKRRKLSAISDDIITLTQRKAALELEVRQLRDAAKRTNTREQQQRGGSRVPSEAPVRTRLAMLYEGLLGTEKANALAAGVEYENEKDAVTTGLPSRTAFVVKRLLSDKKGAPSLMEAAWGSS